MARDSHPSDALDVRTLSTARDAGHSRTDPPKRVHLRSDGSVDMPATLLDSANRVGVETGRFRSDQPNVAAAPRSADPSPVAEIIPPTPPTFFHDEARITKGCFDFRERPELSQADTDTAPRWLATELLAAAMNKARDENPRGNAYRTYSHERLWRMLQQNVEELAIAYRYGNDVADKSADVANFVAFMLDNYLTPPESATS